MTYSFGAKSQAKLAGIHPDLLKVMTRAMETTDLDFAVIEGLRTLERQKALVASGASTTMKSRHLDGHAVDIAPFVDGKIRWDWPLYYKLAATMKAAATDVGVSIEWGGDWKTFKDGPHWQLPWAQYP
jgi:peptidoglycan L-alanyl-D-glutamate endopeptidase CwlK